MREQELQFDEALSKGLRRHHRNPRNVQAAYEFHNVRIGDAGPEPYEKLENPFSGLKLVWPFPQIIEAREYSFLIYRHPTEMEDRIYTFTAGVWDLTFVFAVDEATFDQGTRFDIADFGTYVLLTNGVVMLKYDTQLSAFVPFTSTATIPLCASICDFKGQAIAGGVNSSWHSLGSNGIIWTKIGSMDFTPSRNNEAGFRNADSQVYRVRRLGDVAVVYGSRSMGMLSPVREPTPTFGWEEISEFGICSADAIAGGKLQHVFISEDAWVWSLTQKEGMKKLGYQEYMKQLDLDSVAVTYDRMNNDFYISDGQKCFLLTPQGMSSVHQCVSGVIPYGRRKYGVYHDNGDIAWRWTSDAFDMGYRSTKTINVVEVGGSGSGTIRAGIDWRNRRQQKFARSPMTPVNDQGVAYPTTSGNEFRVVLEASNYEGIEIDYVKARWKQTDLRSIRGIWAPPPRGQ